MIVYFSGTGNSLATARKIAEAIDDQVIPMAEAVKHDLSAESRIGLVYPTYDYAMPPAVRRMLPKLKISPNAYVFVIITCGAQIGISSWTAKRVLKRKGIRVSYCSKIRMPDCAGIVYRRNPNKQTWKFQKYASRMESIIADVKAQKSADRFSGWGLFGWILSAVFNGCLDMLRLFFRPAVNTERCVGCGTCARVCPIGNITMQEREGQNPVPVMGSKCTSCLGCVHFCPHQAMELNGKHPDKSWQYHHPDVTLKDMIMR